MKKIIIIGGGPGGYVAALRAAILGAEVVLVEKGELGGTCLNRGCIPTKAFLQASEVLGVAKTAGAFGVGLGGGVVSPDIGAISARRDALVGQLTMGVGFLLKKRGVAVVNGTGSLAGAGKVSVTAPDGIAQTLEGDAIILATGSVPAIPPVFGYDGEQVLSSDDVVTSSQSFKSLAIVGGGAIGCELAWFYSGMGCEVSVVEAEKHILPQEDEDVVKFLAQGFKKAGIKLHLGSGVVSVDKQEGMVCASLNDGTKVEAEKLIVAVGRRPRLEGLNLDAAGVAMANGRVVTDERMRTNVPGVYAIGDIVGSLALAHVASKEGCVAVDDIMGRAAAMPWHAAPRCVFTDPEVAAVGMTEKDAMAKGINVKIGRFGFSGLGKAMVMGKTLGCVKVLADEEDRIVGAAIVGPHASDLLGSLTMAVHFGMTAAQAGGVIYPHPTLSEAVMEALHDVHGESAHSY